MESLSMSVFEVVGNGLCVAADDGHRVFEQVAAALRKGRPVELSFRNVASLTSAFLNAAIGQLYSGEFSDEQIRSLLKVVDMEQDDLALLKRVIDTARVYFKDPKRFTEIVRDATGEAGDEQSGD